MHRKNMDNTSTNKTIELTGSGTTVAGYIKWQVINQDGSVANEGNHPNLILDAGLDKLATTPYANMFLYNCVGTGNSTPIVTQIGLDTEAGRTNSYLTSPSGSCGTAYYNSPLASQFGSLAPNQFGLQRTFNWATGSLNGTYYELGFSWSASPGNNLWSRALFKDGSGNPIGVSVSSTQQLRVVYQLVVTYGAATWQDGTVNITGLGNVPYKYRAFQPCHYYGQDGTYGIDPMRNKPCAALTLIRYDGNAMSSYYDENYMYGDPYRTYNGDFGFCVKYQDPAYPDYTSWPALNSVNYSSMPYPDTALITYSNSTYVPGSFYYDRTVVFDVNTANGVIQWILTGNTAYYAGCSDVYFLPTPITKDNLHTLTLVFRQTWGRA